MNSWQKQVAEFMQEVKDLELPNRPAIPSLEVAELCVSLIREEGGELFGHLIFDHPQMRTKLGISEVVEAPTSLYAAIADDLVDLIYVVLYTANAYGIDLAPHWEEVHRSNMTKKGGAKRDDGKQLKGPNYEPPDLESIITDQLNG